MRNYCFIEGDFIRRRLCYLLIIIVIRFNGLFIGWFSFKLGSFWCISGRMLGRRLLSVVMMLSVDDKWLNLFFWLEFRIC